MIKYIIVGKAASGKNWMQDRMEELGYTPMKQYTTRNIRDTETGDEYHFISDDEYSKMDNEGFFISSNSYRIGYYGISYLEFITSDVAILSPANVKDIFHNHPELRDVVTIVYLDAPEDVRRKRLESRYVERVDDSTEIRMENDEKDFRNFKDFDVRLVTDEEQIEFINNLPPND